MRRTLVLPLLLLLACGTPSSTDTVTYVPDHDVEIAQAAQIGEPRGPMVLDLYDVKDLVVGVQSFPGEDINLVPSGGFGFGFHHSTSDGDVRAGWVEAFEELQHSALPQVVSIRGLGGEAGPLVNLDDVTAGLEDGASAGFDNGSPRRRPAPRPGRSPLPPHTSRLLVGDDAELPLAGASAAVTVDGFRARVVLDLLYENDRDRQLEGALQLRLPDGARPFYLAFGETVVTEGPIPDLASLVTRPGEAAAPDLFVSANREGFATVKVARMARRERAARAYGETARRRVDPALLEWSGAGVFSARVFPLMPGRVHRIVFGYDVDLTVRDGKLVLDFALPEDLPTRTVTLDVAAAPGLTVSPSRPVAREGDRALHRFPEGAFRVSVTAGAAMMLRGDDPEAGPFFAARLSPELPPAPPRGRPRAVFLLDVSKSSDLPRWTALLADLLRENRPDLREFAVLTFNIDADWWAEGFTPNRPEEVRTMLAGVSDLRPAGATDLRRALAVAAARAGSDCDLFLLSDGFSTWREVGDPDLPGPLFAYAGPGADLGTLVRLAGRSGGAVFDARSDEARARALTAHRSRPWLLRSVTVPGGTDLLLAGDPTCLYPGQILLLAGRGAPAAGAPVSLGLAREGEHLTLTLVPEVEIESDLAPRIFGQIAVGRLEASGIEAGPFAAHFRIPGRTCSLVMLEGEDDYERFGIRPEADVESVRATSVAAALRGARARRREAGESPRAAFRAQVLRVEEGPGLPPEAARRLEGLADHLPAHAPAEGAEPPGEGRADVLTLSELVEDAPGDPRAIREAAHGALAAGRGGAVLPLLADLAARRPWEPDALLLTALAAEQAGEPDLAILTLELLLAGRWADRSGDLARIAAAHLAAALRSPAPPWTGPFRRNELAREHDFGEAGLAVTLLWSTDRTDVDLHVEDPTAEVCFYQHRETKQGGALTTDVTGGFGPELFTLGAPAPGRYRLRVNYFGVDASREGTRTSVLLVIRRAEGPPRYMRAQLGKGKEMLAVATIDFD